MHRYSAAEAVWAAELFARGQQIFSGFLLPQPQFSSENNGKAVSQSVVEEFAAVYEKPTYFLWLACFA